MPQARTEKLQAQRASEENSGLSQVHPFPTEPFVIVDYLLSLRNMAALGSVFTYLPPHGTHSPSIFNWVNMATQDINFAGNEFWDGAYQNSVSKIDWRLHWRMIIDPRFHRLIYLFRREEHRRLHPGRAG
jgi:hypothetical protein